MQAKHVDKIRLKAGQRLTKDFVVVRFQCPKFAQSGHWRVIIDAIQNESPLHFRTTLLDAHSMLRCQHVDFVAAQLQTFHDGFTPDFKRACVVRRIQVG